MKTITYRVFREQESGAKRAGSLLSCYMHLSMKISENKYYSFLIFALLAFLVLLSSVLLATVLGYSFSEKAYSYINVIASITGLSIFITLYEILLSKGFLGFMGYLFIQPILVVGQVALIYFLIEEISNEKLSSI